MTCGRGGETYIKEFAANTSVNGGEISSKFCGIALLPFLHHNPSHALFDWIFEVNQIGESKAGVQFAGGFVF